MIKGVCNFIAVFLAFALLLSCSDKQDFDQLDDLQLTPTYETSVFYVKAQESIINRISGISFFSQDFNFDAFAEPVFANRVLSGVLTYELENTTSKPIEIVLEFLDENDNVLDTEVFRTDAAPTATLTRNVAYGPSGKNLEIIRNTSKIRLNATNLGDNDSESSLPDPAIILRSSAKFTLEVR